MAITFAALVAKIQPTPMPGFNGEMWDWRPFENKQ